MSDTAEQARPEKIFLCRIAENAEERFFTVRAHSRYHAKSLVPPSGPERYVSVLREVETDDLDTLAEVYSLQSARKVKRDRQCPYCHKHPQGEPGMRLHILDSHSRMVSGRVIRTLELLQKMLDNMPVDDDTREIRDALQRTWKRLDGR